MSPPYGLATAFHVIRERVNSPDRAYAARCFQELSRCQGITQSLRRALRHEHHPGVRRRLKYLLRQSVLKERAALQAYRQALLVAAKTILTQYYSDQIPPDRS